MKGFEKYQPFPQVGLRDRKWPDAVITKAPHWCAVDLRDGNQALENPMDHDERVRMFKLLVNLGFKEIEIGFPSASEVDFQFARTLIEENLIPDDVYVQVLTQAREHLIIKTVKSLIGCKNCIIHLYNSTSPAQREIVFKRSKDDIVAIALQGIDWIKREISKLGSSNVVLEYSPESFSLTEVEFSKQICDAVVDEWYGDTHELKEGDAKNQVIINLPATVEVATPNVYADQIEWMSRNLQRRDNIILSVHTHNDRGCAVAASELALLAGADRIEGTVFGNGERTGNVDLVTIALNLFTQGIDPLLDFSEIDKVAEEIVECTNIPIHVRHPYVGGLVYTAFSGSHQDAISKGLEDRKQNLDKPWRVPYLPIDPEDVGRKYEAIIRINSQSGKGGISFVLKNRYGLNLSPEWRKHFSSVVQKISDSTGQELSSEELYKIFFETYLVETNGRYIDYHLDPDPPNYRFSLSIGNASHQPHSKGSGPIDALTKALSTICVSQCEVQDYYQHCLKSGSDAQAISYVTLKVGERGDFLGVGVDGDITKSGLIAVMSAYNNAFLAAI